ncbi:MAG: PLP-dependent aminotransferase family protein [Glaciimonas sp.]|nr:PLP-dependent aminotransferase family protein [Glaciimonas sp.]
MHITQLLASLPLNRDGPTALFRQLYAAIKHAILSGAISPGMQLPPTRDFCHLLGISRQTVLNAYAQLMAEGYLTGSVGKGTFVSERLPIASQLQRVAPALSTSSAATHPAATLLRPLLRPLSSRGLRFVDPMGEMRFHQGKARAFRLGMPDLDLFPFDIWGRLEARCWRRPDYRMGYSDPAGYAPLRALLSVYLRASRGVNCTPEQIVITSGSQQALFLLSSLLLAPDDAVWVENPGYRGAGAPLHAGQARITPVPVDADGLSVAYGARHCPDAKLIYVTPSHQLPLGVTMRLQRRLELLAWAAAHKAWVIEDDYDSEYRYTGPPLASLQSLDTADCVIYVGTLSKVLFPGLRLGYLVAPLPLIEAIVQGKSVIDRHTAIVPQMVLADFIAEGHFKRHIKRTREAYAERREALLQALDAQLADELVCGPTDAGLDFAVYFKKPHDEIAIAQAALAKGIEVRPLSHYASTLANAAPAFSQSQGLLLGFAAISVAQIKHGVAVLRQVLKDASSPG